MIRERDDEWVKEGEKLIEGLEKSNLERQLRIIQGVAEESDSWEAVKLFILYQGSRKETKIGRDWAQTAVEKLELLKSRAEELSRQTRDNKRDLHLELVSRVLGYAVRWQKVEEDLKEEQGKEKTKTKEKEKEGANR
jgi:hypothetical protein